MPGWLIDIENPLSRAGTGSCSTGTFPLTPALSLGERENVRQRKVRRCDPIARRRPSMLPLPKGEGWGGGSGRPKSAERSNGEQNLGESSRGWNRLAFEWFVSPHPGPLPRGEGECSAAQGYRASRFPAATWTVAL